jgi:hypothetical protein
LHRCLAARQIQFDRLSDSLTACLLDLSLRIDLVLAKALSTYVKVRGDAAAATNRFLIGCESFPCPFACTPPNFLHDTTSFMTVSHSSLSLLRIRCDMDVHKIDTSAMQTAHGSSAYHLLQDVPRPIVLNAVVPQLFACPGYGFVNVLLEVACEAPQSIEADAIPQVHWCTLACLCDLSSHFVICKCALSLLDDLGFATDFIRIIVWTTLRVSCFTRLNQSRYLPNVLGLQRAERLHLFDPRPILTRFWFAPCSWDADSTLCTLCHRFLHLS